MVWEINEKKSKIDELNDDEDYCVKHDERSCVCGCDKTSRNYNIRITIDTNVTATDAREAINKVKADFRLTDGIELEDSEISIIADSDEYD